MAVAAWEASAGDAAGRGACVKAADLTMKALVLEGHNAPLRLADAVEQAGPKSDQRRTVSEVLGAVLRPDPPGCCLFQLKPS